MEANRVQDLQLASWEPRTADGAVQVWVRPVDKDCWWCGFCLKADRLETQEELMFQLDGSQEEFFYIWKRVSLLFFSGFQLIGRGPPSLGRAICLIHFVDLNVELILKHPYRNTQNIWALFKSTHKINYHRLNFLFLCMSSVGTLDSVIFF